VPCRLAAAVGPNGRREHYMRARVEAAPDGWRCTASARQDSSLLSVLAEANALLVRPPGDPERKAGALVEFIWF
jgi:molybdopterin molybdotransferase